MTERVRAAAADLTKFQLRCLAVVADQPGLNGLDTKAELETTYYDGEIRHGRLYPNLDDLVDAGLVEKRQRDRRTNAYHITELGDRVLTFETEWLATRRESSDDAGTHEVNAA